MLTAIVVALAGRLTGSNHVSGIAGTKKEIERGLKTPLSFLGFYMAATQYTLNPKTKDEVLRNVYDPVTNSLQYRSTYIVPVYLIPKNADEVFVNVYDPLTNTIA